jgi:hypothetical protein
MIAMALDVPVILPVIPAAPKLGVHVGVALEVCMHVEKSFSSLEHADRVCAAAVGCA